MTKCHLFAVSGLGLAVGVLFSGCKPASSGLSETQWEAEHSYPTCAFSPGQLASETLPASWPTGKQIPIDHIVLVMQENRSFDQYFSGLTNGADVASPTATNPDDEGHPFSRFHWTASTASLDGADAGTSDAGTPNVPDGYLCFDDTNHSWSAQHTSWDNGKNDGFIPGNDPVGERAMGYYDQSDLPFYYALAQDFAISDRHFCSVLGPTWPNRMFYEAGTSFGLTENNLPSSTSPSGKAYQNIMLEINQAKLNWQVFDQDVPTEAIFADTWANNIEKFHSIQDFMSAAQGGTLPDVSFVEASDGSSHYPIALDEHPPADFQLGQQFLSQIVQAVMTSPEWAHTALFITYDENGGQYDHVPPPSACAPDDLPADAAPTDGFNQYGFRVPLLVVSPYAKHGYVSHHVSDHTSILRFVESRFDLPAMTKRDANADPLFDMFDFSHPDTTVPTLPTVTVDQTQENACLGLFGSSVSGF